MNRENISLLNSIDCIDEAQNEAETNLVFSMYNEYAKMYNMQKYSKDKTIIIESFNSSNNDNILSKGLKFLLRILSKIKDIAVRIRNKIYNKFNGELKGVTKTIRQIVYEIKPTVVKESHNINPGHIDYFFNLFITPDGKHVFRSNNLLWKIRELESRYSNKPLLKELIKMHKYHDSRDDIDCYAITKFYLAYKNKIDNLISNFIRILSNIETNGISNNEIESLYVDLQKYYNQWGSMISVDNVKLEDIIFDIDKCIILSEEDIQSIALSIDNVFKNMPDLNQILNIKKLPDMAYEMFNDITNMFMHIQINLNQIYRTLKMSFQLPENCHNSFNLMELDNFIYQLIDNKYPGKYIFNLVGIAAKTDLKNETDDHLWGQTRGCLLPKNRNVAYKFAISQKGITDNISEIQIYELFKQKHLKSIHNICEIKNHEKHNCVLTMEKLHFKDVLNENEITRIIQEIHDELERNNINFIFDNDFHENNVGFRKNGTMVLSDYANTLIVGGR